PGGGDHHRIELKKLNRDTGVSPVRTVRARARRPCHGRRTMEFLNKWLLTILIFLPTAGAVLVMIARDRETIRRTALATTIVTFALSLLLFATFKWGLSGPYAYATVGPDGEYVPGSGTVQMVQEGMWIPAFNIEYKL